MGWGVGLVRRGESEVYVEGQEQGEGVLSGE